MDIGKRYSIAWKGLEDGSHAFDFEVDASLFEAFGNTEIKGGACHVHAVLHKVSSTFDVAVAIRGTVVVVCDRCLEDCSVPVAFDGSLTVRVADEPYEYDGETLWLAPGDDLLPLAQYIYESIVLSLPYRRVHPEGGCNPDMLRRFRIVSEEEFDRIEERAGAGNGVATGETADRLASLRRQLETEERSGE